MNVQDDYITITGKIVRVLTANQTPTGSPYQNLIIKQIYSKYPNIVAVTVWDKEVNKYHEGQDVIAYITIESKLSTKGDFYTHKINAWKIFKY